ncbi:MAG: RluA family pseudouridine synthase [Treponemataceae bacterium]
MNSTEILFENNEIRIINKPYNLACQGGKGIEKSVDTVLAKQTGEKIFLIHRLDKETCGILITAKNSKAAARWTNLIGTKQIQKTYHAVCFYTMKKKEGIIKDNVIQNNREKNAVTRFRVLKEFFVHIPNESDKDTANKNTKSYNVKPIPPSYDSKIQTENEILPISLIEVTLETGRTHQLRQHLAKNGCPIIQDDKYGDFKKNKLIQKKFGIKKMQLTAKKIKFCNELEKELKINEIEISYHEHISNSLDIFNNNSYNRNELENKIIDITRREH